MEARDKEKGFWSGLDPRLKAVLVALFVYPGAGQLMNGHKIKGIALGLAFTVVTVVALFQVALALADFYQALTRLEEVPDLGSGLLKPLCWLVASGILWLYSVTDAWLGAPRRPEA